MFDEKEVTVERPVQSELIVRMNVGSWPVPPFALGPDRAKRKLRFSGLLLA